LPKQNQYSSRAQLAPKTTHIFKLFVSLIF
jgi:hypothetical protein